MNEQLVPSTLKIGKRESNKNITVGLELGNGWLVPIGVVKKDTSKYKPHQGEREKARRLKKQEQHAQPE